jgi:hypothetical protein
LFDRLCAQLPVTIEDRDRAARPGFDLAAPYCPFVAQLPGARVAGHAGLAARLRTAGTLAFTEGVRVAGLTAPGSGAGAELPDRGTASAGLCAQRRAMARLGGQVT